MLPSCDRNGKYAQLAYLGRRETRVPHCNRHCSETVPSFWDAVRPIRAKTLPYRPVEFQPAALHRFIAVPGCHRQTDNRQTTV